MSDMTSETGGGYLAQLPREIAALYLGSAESLIDLYDGILTEIIREGLHEREEPGWEGGWLRLVLDLRLILGQARAMLKTAAPLTQVRGMGMKFASARLRYMKLEERLSDALKQQKKYEGMLLRGERLSGPRRRDSNLLTAPSLPADSEVNRPKKQFKMRLYPEQLGDLEQAVGAGNRNAWMEEAIAEKLLRDGIEPTLQTERGTPLLT